MDSSSLPTISGADIIVTGQQIWDTPIGSNCKNIAEEFSKNNRVLYINSPLDRKTLLNRKDDADVIKRKAYVTDSGNGIEQIGDNLWTYYPKNIIESITWIPNTGIFQILNKFNNHIFSRDILSAVKVLNFRKDIHFNDNDIFRCFFLKEMLNVNMSVYYSRDNMVSVDYWRRHGVSLEPRLIAKSDVCVANSVYLTNYCKKYNQHSYYVGQGCETEFFTSNIGAPMPETLKHLHTPIIGYVGSHESIRLDVELLVSLAIEKPDWNFVFVGPEDDVFRQSQLHHLPNVLFTGPKPFEELPTYINSFDVCLNPQLLNEVTIGNYPRKIDEYLAMGKPVVATWTEAMEAFADFTYLAKGNMEYVSYIERALSENTPEKSAARIKFASAHTWKNSVADIYKAILTKQP